MLASDRFEGRAPGGPGEELTVAYLVDQFRQAGLQPGNPDGTFIQRVPLVGITPEARVSLTFRRGGQRRTLRYPDDFVAWTKRVVDRVSLEESELVFVGYGVQAPEYGWDDYKGLDVRGKTLVMLVNDPPVPDPADPTVLNPAMFGGRAMTYYGRWTYKFEMAAAQGAAGAFVVHETGPAGYPYDVVKGNTGEKFDLVTADRNMGRVAVEGWMTRDQAEGAPRDVGPRLRGAQGGRATREFEPVPLGTTASMVLRNALRTVSSQNVVARVEGGDPAIKDEHVIYMAHWDHLGRGAAVDGDDIYNGAVDNATGTAGLIEIGRAFASLSPPPRRSILLLAVTAEEQGLLGSQYYAVDAALSAGEDPGRHQHGRVERPRPHAATSRSSDWATPSSTTTRAWRRPGRVGFSGRTRSRKRASTTGPTISTSPSRACRRSTPTSGIEFVGKPAEYSQQVRDTWTNTIYHSPQDEVQDDWDLGGLVEDLELLWTVGDRVAQADAYPRWSPGTEFEAIRERMLRTHN